MWKPGRARLAKRPRAQPRVLSPTGIGPEVCNGLPAGRSRPGMAEPRAHGIEGEAHAREVAPGALGAGRRRIANGGVDGGPRWNPTAGPGPGDRSRAAARPRLVHRGGSN